MNGRRRSGVKALAPLVALLTAVVVFASSCVSNAPQDTLKPAGPRARTIHHLIVPVFGIAGT